MYESDYASVLKHGGSKKTETTKDRYGACNFFHRSTSRNVLHILTVDDIEAPAREYYAITSLGQPITNRVSQTSHAQKN